MLGIALVVLLVAGAIVFTALSSEEETPSFRDQACGLPPRWLELTQRGYFEPRSGQISLLPRTPAYMASGGGGWSHSGPWPYLQHVPLVFYGPGFVPATGQVDRPVTLADIAPTIATHDARFAAGKRRHGTARGRANSNADTLTEGTTETDSHDRVGRRGMERLGAVAGRLGEPARHDGRRGVVTRTRPTGRLPRSRRPCTPPWAPGVLPWKHGITGVPMRDEEGEVVDAFLDGESSRFIQTPTLAERWDEQTDNEAKIGMVGYEPWHLGMIGKGAERARRRQGRRGVARRRDERVDHEPRPLPVAAVRSRTHRAWRRTWPSSTRRTGRSTRRGSTTRSSINPSGGRRPLPSSGTTSERSRTMINEEGYGADETTDLLFTNFKQIDRVGHYFNMDSEEVNESLLVTDEMLGDFLAFLDDEIGHGQLRRGADRRSRAAAGRTGHRRVRHRPERGRERTSTRSSDPITRAVWPTEVFLEDEAMEEESVECRRGGPFPAGLHARGQRPRRTLSRGASSPATGCSTWPSRRRCCPP